MTYRCRYNLEAKPTTPSGFGPFGCTGWIRLTPKGWSHRKVTSMTDVEIFTEIMRNNQPIEIRMSATCIIEEIPGGQAPDGTTELLLDIERISEISFDYLDPQEGVWLNAVGDWFQPGQEQALTEYFDEEIWEKAERGDL